MLGVSHHAASSLEQDVLMFLKVILIIAHSSSSLKDHVCGLLSIHLCQHAGTV